jgi:hypothetical protein
LAPQLRKCDIVVLDTLRAQKDPRVRWILQASSAMVALPAAVLVRLQPDRERVGVVEEAHSAFGPRTADAPRQVARAVLSVLA